MKVILEDHILVVGVPEEVRTGHCVELSVEELVGVPIRELDSWVFKVAYSFKHLISYLRVESNGTVFELVEGGVIGSVNVDELFL